MAVAVSTISKISTATAGAPIRMITTILIAIDNRISTG
jgi:hypothetical protein